MLCIGVLEVDCVAVVEILVLGAVFVVEVVELVVRCVVGHAVRLVLWCDWSTNSNITNLMFSSLLKPS